jgi:hypothetical protein
MRTNMIVLAGTGWLAACAAQTPSTVTTGAAGTVRRGPITPVCTEGVTCDAPFSGDFKVERANRIVATFHSDSDGHFSVMLAPGSYQVVAGPGAPVLDPGNQQHPITVGPDGLTTVDLLFDTGIR